jgi:hypothetical protein
MRPTVPKDLDRRELILEFAGRVARHWTVERVWLFGSRARRSLRALGPRPRVEAPGIDPGEWTMLRLVEGVP